MSGVEGKSRRQALTEFREAEILQAARKIFGEHGFNAATVDLIAAEAGIAKGTLYLYFDSKEEIFWAALKSRFSQMLERAKQEMGKVAGARAKVLASLRVRFEFFRSDEEFMRMYLTEFGRVCGAPPPHRQPVQDLYRESAEHLAGILAEGIQAGELRPLEPLETAMVLMELVKGVFAMRFSGVPGQNPDFDGERFVFEIFWHGVAAPAAEARGRHEPSGRSLPAIEARPQATSGSDQTKSGEPPEAGKS